MDQLYEEAGTDVKGVTGNGSEITILATGGTIATVRAPDGRTVPALEGSELHRRGGDSPAVELTVEQLFQTPSWALSPADMAKIARRAAELSQSHGVVVTHGTTTLEYTALLTDLFARGPYPIVFTGAMKRADDPTPDGPANLADAILVASSDDARDAGVLICFAGEIFAARETSKQHRHCLRPYVAPDGPIGRITADSIAFSRKPPPRPHHFDSIETSVTLIKAFPGAGAALIDAAVDDGTKGIVIEGLPGSGGIPKEMQKGLRRAREGGVVVVVTSSARLGSISQGSDGGTGEPLRDLDVVIARSSTSEQAWVLLMAALGSTSDVDGVREIFDAADR